MLRRIISTLLGGSRSGAPARRPTTMSRTGRGGGIRRILRRFLR